MWLFTEWQQFNAQFEAEEKRTLKFREYTTLNEKLSLKNDDLEDIVEFAQKKNNTLQTIVEFAQDHDDVEFAQKKNNNTLQTIVEFAPDHDDVAAKGAIIDEPVRKDTDEEDIVDDVFPPDENQRKALLYRVGLGIITIVGCVCLLAMPQVPEKFLGIRSPSRVLMEYRLTPHPGNDSILHPVEVNQSHSIHKRHIRIPHKFWAKARPHNKFKKKKRYAHLPQVQAPPAGPVPNPQLVNMKH